MKTVADTFETSTSLPVDSKKERRRKRAVERGYVQPKPHGFKHILVREDLAKRTQKQHDALLLHDAFNKITSAPSHYLADAIGQATGHVCKDDIKLARQVNKRATAARHQWDETPSLRAFSLADCVPPPTDLFSLHVQAFNLLFGMQDSDEEVIYASIDDKDEFEDELAGTSVFIYGGHSDMGDESPDAASSSYFFDREYGLHNVSQSSGPSHDGEFMDYDRLSHCATLGSPALCGLSMGAANGLHGDSRGLSMEFEEFDDDFTERSHDKKWIDSFSSEGIDDGDASFSEAPASQMHDNGKGQRWVDVFDSSAESADVVDDQLHEIEKDFKMHEDTLAFAAPGSTSSPMRVPGEMHDINLHGTDNEEFEENKVLLESSVCSLPSHGTAVELHEKLHEFEQNKVLHEPLVLSIPLHETSGEHLQAKPGVWEHLQVESLVAAPWRRRRQQQSFDMTFLDLPEDLQRQDFTPPGSFSFVTNPGFGIRNLLPETGDLHDDLHEMHDEDSHEQKGSVALAEDSVDSKLHGPDVCQDSTFEKKDDEGLQEHDHLHVHDNTLQVPEQGFVYRPAMADQMVEEGSVALAEDSVDSKSHGPDVCQDSAFENEDEGLQEHDHQHVHDNTLQVPEQGFVYRLAMADQMVECISIQDFRALVESTLDRAYRVCTWSDAHRQWMEAAVDMKEQRDYWRDRAKKWANMASRRGDSMEHWSQQCKVWRDRTFTWRSRALVAEQRNVEIEANNENCTQQEQIGNLNIQIENLRMLNHKLMKEKLENRHEHAEATMNSKLEHDAQKTGKNRLFGNSGNSGKNENEERTNTSRESENPRKARKRNERGRHNTSRRTLEASCSKQPEPIGPSQEHETPGCAENPSSAPLPGNPGPPNLFETCTCAGNSAAFLSAALQPVLARTCAARDTMIN